MARYRFINANTVYDTVVNASQDINDVQYKAWLAAGNTPDPAPAGTVQFQAPNDLYAQLRTNTGTVQEMFRGPLQANSMYRALLTMDAIVPVGANAGLVRSWTAKVVLKRLGAGAIMVAAPVVLADQGDAGAVNWTVPLSVNGNDFVVSVKGDPTIPIEWMLTGTFVRLSPTGS